MLSGVEWRDTEIFYLKHRGPIYIDGVVVNHLHDGHTKIASNAEGDAEAQAAHDGDNVAAGQAEALAVAQRGFLLSGLPWPSILRELDHFPGFLPPFYNPATTRG